MTDAVELWLHMLNLIIFQFAMSNCEQEPLRLGRLSSIIMRRSLRNLGEGIVYITVH